MSVIDIFLATALSLTQVMADAEKLPEYLHLEPTPVSSEWSVEDMNKTIDQTNFIVNDGCSGTLISLEKKIILTNYHCIERNVTSVEREVTNKDGFIRKVKVRKYEDVPLSQLRYDGFEKVGASSYTGEIVAEDQTVDLALIRVKGIIPQTMASSLSDDPVVRGESVYIVGNPAMNFASLVQGIVSNVNRSFDFSWTNGGRLPMIQFSGGIYGGNSGGALYNSRGSIIGVPAAGFGGANFIGLAIPTKEVVKPFIQRSCYESIFNPEASDEDCRKKKEDKKEARDGSN